MKTILARIESLERQRLPNAGYAQVVFVNVDFSTAPGEPAPRIPAPNARRIIFERGRGDDEIEVFP